MRISLRKISIKTRLVLIISLTVLAVLVGQSLTVYFQSKAIVEEMAFSAAREQAQLNAATLEAWIRGVNLTELSEREVGEGSLVVKAVGDSFLEIVQGVQQLSGQFAGVLAATQQMAAGIEQVAAASQEQTASSEEVAAATESLRQMSHGLNDMVRRFRV